MVGHSPPGRSLCVIHHLRISFSCDLSCGPTSSSWESLIRFRTCFGATQTALLVLCSCLISNYVSCAIWVRRNKRLAIHGHQRIYAHLNEYGRHLQRARLPDVAILTSSWSLSQRRSYNHIHPYSASSLPASPSTPHHKSMDHVSASSWTSPSVFWTFLFGALLMNQLHLL